MKMATLLRLGGLAMAGLAMLTACERPAGEPAAKADADTATMAAPESSTPASPSLRPSGMAQALTPDSNTELQMAASVIKLDELNQQGDLTAKLFGTAGGDPAMNGLYTHIAFFDSVPDGWRLFMLGDVLDYTILAEAPGRVDLELHESTMNDATGEIGDRKRKVIVTWTPGEGDTAPASVSVAPAD